jgi:hypothetical protein
VKSLYIATRIDIYARNSHEGEYRDHSIISIQSAPKGLIITKRSLGYDSEVQSFETTEIKLNGARGHHGSPAMMPSIFVFHPLQLPARRDLSRPHISEGTTWSNRFKQG